MNNRIESHQDIELILSHLQPLLKTQAWELGITRWQAVYDVLLHLQHSDNLPANTRALRQILAPLLCKNPLQQQQFEPLFTQSVRQAFPSTEGIAKDQSQPSLLAGFKHRTWWLLLCLLTIMTLAAGYSVYLQQNHKGGETPSLTPTSSPDAQTETPLPADDKTAEKPLLSEFVEGVRVNNPGPWALLSQNRRSVLIAVLVALFLAGLIGLWLLNRSQFQLKNHRAQYPYREYTFSLDHDSGQYAAVIPRVNRPSNPLKSARRARRIQWRKTLAYAIQHPGEFRLFRRQKSRTPSYLILVDRASAYDQISTYAELLIKQLQRLGRVHAFSFVGDPRFCYQPHSAQTFHLKHLQSDYPTACLMVISDGAGAVNAFSRQLHPWLIDLLVGWSERCWLTPDAMPWGDKQRCWEAQGFLVAPLSANGLNVVFQWLALHPRSSLRAPTMGVLLGGQDDEQFPELLYDVDRWLDETPSRRCQQVLDDQSLNLALTRYLGEEGRRLLWACALYPEIHAYITLTLDLNLFSNNTPAARESRLLKLSRLPWFRRGKMPLYLRKYFSQQLKTEDYEHIKRVLSDVKFVDRLTDQPAADIFVSKIYDAKAYLQSDKNDEQPLVDVLMIKLLQGWRNRRWDFLLSNTWMQVLQVKAKVRAQVAVQSSIMAMLLTIGLMMLSVLFFNPQSIAAAGDNIQIPIPAMVAIPAGTFTMGCLSNDADCQADEQPAHEVNISAFKISATEVTFAQYDFYCNQVASCELPEDEGWGRGDRPVINVSWEEAQAYIQWLNKSTGKTYRLPTEAEWEYAARAGSTTKYSWGNEPSAEHANGGTKAAWESVGAGDRWQDEWVPWPEDGYVTNTAPVGSYQPNAWGLYDMHGNVWEWVQDWYGENYYQNSPSSNPQGPASGDYRVLRGGSWYFDALLLRSARRLRLQPDFRVFYTGFRLSLGQPPVSPSPAAQPPSLVLPELQEQVNGVPVSKMVEIPAGSFQMGCLSNDSDCSDDEKPVHEVNLRAFKLGAGEVTFAQYDFYCDQVEACERPNDEGWGRDNRPVINVSWVDAQAYIQWLNEKTGRNYRLPTEAEWEYAARAGSTTKYSWGNEPSAEHANGGTKAAWESQGVGDQWEDGWVPWLEDGHVTNTAPVGIYQPNAWGLYDMSGNVYEWVQDWYDENYYQNSPSSNPQGPATGDRRVLRGGSWSIFARDLRSALRSFNEPGDRDSRIGFRLSLGQPPASPSPAAEPPSLVLPELQEQVNGVPVSKMVEIPAGSFQMGCLSDDGDCSADEKPAHEVSLSAFEMGASEVTFAQYDFYCDQVEACERPDDEGWGRDNRPVINVSWEDAQAYIEWLNAQTGRNYRLPTEAEWEYAARAGSTTKYSWGNEPSGEHANGPQNPKFGEPWPEDGFENTAPVGNYKPNDWGLYDMHGNVREWVQDWYGENYYQNSPSSNPQGPASGDSRMLRGGSWFILAQFLRSANRSLSEPGLRNFFFGFRLSLDE